MTGGVGFIGLAVMIFGRWMSTGALAAGLVFGFSRALRQKVALLGTPVSSELLEMSPFVVAIIMVAGVVGKARPPAADGVPYIKYKTGSSWQAARRSERRRALTL